MYEDQMLPQEEFSVQMITEETITNEEALRLALEIIKRQDALLKKYGIDPREDPET